MGWLLKLGLAVVVGLFLYRLLRKWMGPPSAMSIAEARALLGVGEAASLGEIREAHRRLIARVHPDTGGSAELATRVNAARDALVANLNRKPPSAS
jgi:DnaJ homolog subfamily C member 19